MKKILCVVLVFVIALSVNAQVQKMMFVGLVGPDKLALNGGFEIATKAKNKKAFFIRPTYSPAFFRNYTVAVKYIDVPFGLKYIVTSENAYLIDFNVGPYIGYGISGKYPTGSFVESDIKFGAGSGAQMEPLDYGIFLNTQIALGQTFGFGVSTQVALKEHDLSKLGTAVTTAKEKARKQLQVTVFVNIGKRKK